MTQLAALPIGPDPSGAARRSEQILHPLWLVAAFCLMAVALSFFV